MTTHQTASAVVVNDTGKTIQSANLVHKYSDNYNNKHDWGVLQPGESSTPMTVDYNTGFLATGLDWWFLTWTYAGDSRTYYTNPQNFRGLIDFLEQTGMALPKLLETAANLYPNLEEAAAIGKVISDTMLNSETTDGFKEHMLTAEDAGKITRVVIHANNTVEWKSPSGNSSTVSAATGTLPITDFVGSCGEGTSRGNPKVVTCATGLQPDEWVSVNGKTDLSSCLVANDGGRVYNISMTTATGSSRIYNYVLNVDARGPSGWLSGSMHLAFTDQSNDTYRLAITSSTRKKHTVSFNSDKPAIVKIYWSNYDFSV